MERLELFINDLNEALFITSRKAHYCQDKMLKTALLRECVELEQVQDVALKGYNKLKETRIN